MKKGFYQSNYFRVFVGSRELTRSRSVVSQSSRSVRVDRILVTGTDSMDKMFASGDPLFVFAIDTNEIAKVFKITYRSWEYLPVHFDADLGARSTVESVMLFDVNYSTGYVDLKWMGEYFVAVPDGNMIDTALLDAVKDMDKTLRIFAQVTQSSVEEDAVTPDMPTVDSTISSADGSTEELTPESTPAKKSRGRQKK